MSIVSCWTQPNLVKRERKKVWMCSGGWNLQKVLPPESFSQSVGQLGAGNENIDTEKKQ